MDTAKHEDIENMMEEIGKKMQHKNQDENYLERVKMGNLRKMASKFTHCK